MYILALDTATNCGGIALSRNAEVIGQVMLKAPLRYSEEVLSCVEFLLEGLRLKRTQVGCFAVASGPGSFTGLRIGLATIKAFAQSLGRPAVGLSTLEALAFRFRWARSRIVPMIDARRQQIYGACYRIDPDTDVGVGLEVQEQVAPPAEFLEASPPWRPSLRRRRRTAVPHHDPGPFTPGRESPVRTTASCRSSAFWPTGGT